ncbi:MAG TPA: hypothetical protein VKP67_15385, partial [Xanthobacteraceae bacterium]|nr:hypothetical protein [Xanthobacteraceae bacterium]
DSRTAANQVPGCNVYSITSSGAGKRGHWEAEAEHRRSFALHRSIACAIFFVCVSLPLQLTISERWYSLRHVRRYDLG